MTVNTENIVTGPYEGNDIADEFSYNFRIENSSQIEVYQTIDDGFETILILDTDYTVNTVGVDIGGTITRIAGALPTGYKWWLRANYRQTQLTAFSSQGGFFPDVHEAVMDKLTFLIQQLSEELDRSVKVDVTSEIDPDDLVQSLLEAEINAANSASEAEGYRDECLVILGSEITIATVSRSVLGTERIIVIDATLGDVVLTFLSASDVTAKSIKVQRSRADVSGNTVTLSPFGGETLGNDNAFTIQPGEGYEFIPDKVSDYLQF